MTLPVREKTTPLAHIHDEIDRLFQEFPMRNFWPFRENAGRMPALDVYEKDGNLVVEAELPGIDKKDLKVTYTGMTVTIEGETKREKEEKKEGHYRMEREYGNFYRTIPLPQPVDFANARAECKDGVLTITLPKAAPAEEKPCTIPVME